jgi:hypothetical protein
VRGANIRWNTYKNDPSLTIVGGDKVILRNKDVLFQDKMKAAYNTKIYTVTAGTTANSLKLVDAGGNEKKVKKS